MMIRWWEHSQKGVTDRQTDGQTENTICRAAWSQLKTIRQFYTTSSFVHNLKSMGEFKLKLQSGNAQFGSKLVIFVLCDLEIWWRTLKHNRGTLLYYIKFCASFQIHRWIRTWVIVRKCPIWVKIGDFLFRVTFKFDGWPWKTKGHLFKTTLSSVHHFKAMGEFKLELQSGKTLNSGQNLQFFVLCDLEIWRMTLKNHSAPLLCHFKLCASFHSHQWIQTGITVWKRPMWVKINDFFLAMTWKFDGWPWKTIGHLF